MSRKNENKKGANGAGSIRKITTTRNGKEYTYWQGRYTEGYDACTGKQIQRSITGKTQKEVAQNLRQITAEIDAKTYVAPCKLSISEWMSIWAQDYLVGVKASTAYLYRRTIELYIDPHLGHIRLDALNAHTVQHFYNELAKPGVTLSLLWAEYCAKCEAEHTIPYQHTQFNEKYHAYAASKKAMNNPVPVSLLSGDRGSSAIIRF